MAQSSTAKAGTTHEVIKEKIKTYFISLYSTPDTQAFSWW